MHEIFKVCRVYLHMLKYSCCAPDVKKNVFYIFHHYSVLFVNI